MRQHKDNVRGSITIEAAIALPVFICVAISLAMLIKLVTIHDIIQHSIDEAANELAMYSYIYHISDIQKIDDTIQDNLDENSERAKEHIGVLVDAFGTLEKAYTTGSDFTEDIKDAATSETSFAGKADKIITQADSLFDVGQQLSQQSINTINSLSKALEEACRDPKKEAESIAWMLSKGIYSDAKTIIAVPLVKYAVKSYLPSDEMGDVDKSLRKLNIYNGFEGLDFYSSTFFQGDEDIDIVVAYKVELPLPIKILPDIYMTQRSTARAWLNGGDGTLLQGTSIWDLPNKQRGMKIEELYGGNLAYDFPVIDKYDTVTKTGTSIKSINLNSKTYQDKLKLKNVLQQYVDEIKYSNSIKYKQQNYDLALKKLIVVIPKGSINENNKVVVEQIKAYAVSSGIAITISEL
ncbi:MAG: hypothetical protein A2Y23_00370 [Clostridiales bacterium GWB2_37_7]|nr:MAG: hypothetical protein A2Y23_00370 [Clostridiales bacterium GWB2_37_7]